MEWALTLNRHRLYDAWYEGSARLQISPRNCRLGLEIINATFRVAANPGGSDDGRAIVLLAGVAAGAVVGFFEMISFVEICNIVLAACLWTAVKVYSLVVSSLFTEVNELDILEKPILFLAADHLEVNELIAFLGLYTHDIRVEYLKETSHPERLQRILEWYHGTVKELPEKWEDAIYSAGLSMKKLTLEDGVHIQKSFPNIVKWFPNMTELTINDTAFDASCLEPLKELRYLKRLKVAKLDMGAQDFNQVYEALSKLRWLERLEMPLRQLTVENLKMIAESMPDLNALLISDCTAEITSEHVKLLKSLKNLSKLSLEGNLTWQNGDVLRSIGDLKDLTHLVLRPRALSANISAADIPTFRDMSGLEWLQLDYFPINNNTLQQLAESNVSLHTLTLKWCHNFSEIGLRDLKQLPHLKALYLVSCEGVDDAAIRRVAECTRLKTLVVRTSGRQVSDEAIQTLAKCTLLEECRLSDTNIASNGLKSIAENCPELETLVLQGSASLENRDMEHVSKLPKLRLLSLDHCAKISNLAVKKISRIATLRVFSAAHTKLTSGSWKQWKNHPALESLTMHGRRIWPKNAEIAHLPPQLTYLDVRDAQGLDVEELHQQCPNLKTLHPGGDNLGAVPHVVALDRFQGLERLFLNTMRFPLYELRSAVNQFASLSALPKMKRIYVNPDFQNACQVIGLPLPASVEVA